MKKIALIFLAAVAVVSINFSAFAGKDESTGKVIAYYFHGTFRCYTCNLMEKYSREAIETNFKDALAAGKLEFKAVNVEETWNKHFINDYNLYTKSLILSLVKNGKETKSKNLTKIWEYSSNRQKLLDYVREEMNNFLKEAK